MPESEARKIAIVFEETAAYEYKQNKEQARHGGRSSGLQEGFEEDFSFGEEDNIDYWHFKDEGVEIVD